MSKCIDRACMKHTSHGEPGPPGMLYALHCQYEFWTFVPASIQLIFSLNCTLRVISKLSASLTSHTLSYISSCIEWQGMEFCISRRYAFKPRSELNMMECVILYCSNPYLGFVEYEGLSFPQHA
jgi:hypothetical protein